MAKTYGGRWSVVGSLGQGGQAEIFNVDDLRKEVVEPVVLKRIRNGARRSRFVDEVSACKRLSHPNIMRVIDHSALEVEDDRDKKMYLVMPLMKAGPLDKRVALYKDSLDSTLKVASALADALEHAHANHVLHRDVKPANILFASDDHVPTLSDFGICLIRNVERSTEIGERVGPWDFMAPELFAGGQLEVSPSVDIYSLGKVIYFMLSGGVVLHREDLRRPGYDIFNAKGGRYLMLASLLEHMICPLERRIKTMAEVKARFQRIKDWEEKQGPVLTTGAKSAIATILASQRAKVSLAEHNAQIQATETSILKNYADVVAAWLDERVNELIEAISNPGLISAHSLTSDQLTESAADCVSLHFDSTRAVLRLVASRGLQVALATGFHRTHRLLLNIYVVHRPWLRPTNEMTDVVDQDIVFAPFYFSSKTWQDFFSAVSGPVLLRGAGARGPNKRPFNRASNMGQSNAISSIAKEEVLRHETTVAKWPEDAGDYRHAIDAAVQRLLERLEKWSTESTIVMDL